MTDSSYRKGKVKLGKGQVNSVKIRSLGYSVIWAKNRSPNHLDQDQVNRVKFQIRSPVLWIQLCPGHENGPSSNSVFHGVEFMYSFQHILVIYSRTTLSGTFIINH